MKNRPLLAPSNGARTSQIGLYASTLRLKGFIVGIAVEANWRLQLHITKLAT
jgi:hypothetical protein